MQNYVITSNADIEVLKSMRVVTTRSCVDMCEDELNTLKLKQTEILHLAANDKFLCISGSLFSL